jgi:hypothetical protein
MENSVFFLFDDEVLSHFIRFSIKVSIAKKKIKIWMENPQNSKLIKFSLMSILISNLIFLLICHQFSFRLSTKNNNK